MRKGNFPAAPLVLAMILGPILERAFHQSLSIAAGDFMIFLRRPISTVLLLLAVSLMLTPVARQFWKKRRGSPVGSAP